MATPIFRVQPGNFDIHPNILPPTQGDLEEARVKHLLDLARLTQLKQEPLIQQQQLDLQRQRMALEKLGLGETGRHNVATEEQSNAQLAEAVKQHQTDALLRQAGLNVEQRGQDITTRGQDVTARGQDIGLQTAHDVISAENERAKMNARTQTTDTLIHALTSNPNVLHPEEATRTLAKVLALRGDPELLKVIGEQQPASKSATAEATLKLLQGDGTVGPNGAVNPSGLIPSQAKNSELDSLLQNIIPAYGTGKKVVGATGNNETIKTLLKLLVPAYGVPDELLAHAR